MHEAEVHLFICSVLRMGNQAINMPDIKFYVRWKEHLVHHKESARSIDGAQHQFRFHIFLGSKKNETVLRIDEWIRGMMNEIPISSKGPKGGNALFLQDAERSAAQFGKFKPGTSCTLIQVQTKLGNWTSTQTTPKRKVG